MLKMVAAVGSNERIGIRGGMGDLTGGYTTTLTFPSPLTLPNSASKSLKLSLAGASEQDSTTGAQLLPPLNIPDGEVNGVKYWMEEGCVVLDGTSTAGTTEKNDMYFVGGHNGAAQFYSNAGFPVGEINVRIYDIPNGVTFCVVRGSDKVVIAGLNVVTKTWTFTHVEGETYRIMLRVAWPNATFNKSKVRVMINAGTTAKPWEPYTGGKPSPSPEYPQEIRSAGVRTKNLVDASKIQHWTQTGEHLEYPYYIKTKPNTEYCTNLSMNCVQFYDENKNLISEASKREAGMFVTPDECKYIKMRTWFGYEDINYFRKNFQLEEGSTATAYEPYGYKADIRIHNNGYLMRGTYFAQVQSIQLVKGRAYTITSNNVGNNINAFIFNGSPGAPVRNSSELYGYGHVTLKLQTPNSSGFVDSPCQLPMNYNDKYTFTVTVDGLYLYQAINQPRLNTDDFYIYDGDIVGSNVPCQEQTATIYTKEPLRGIGDCKDVICKKGGVWGVDRKVAERVFDGDSQIGSNGGIRDGVFLATCKFEEIVTGVSKPGLCDKLMAGLGYTERFSLGYKTLYLFIDATRLNGTDTTLADLKQWLSNNPLTVAAERETPVWTPLDDATQATLNALTAYKGTTVIGVDSGDVPMQITAEYKKKKGR